MTSSTTLRHPDQPPAHPGAIMAEVIESLDIGKAEMARQLGVTRAALYNVIDQRSGVSAAMALRFEAATGTSADLLVRMQAGYDLWTARRQFRQIAGPRPAKTAPVTRVSTPRRTTVGGLAVEATGSPKVPAGKTRAGAQKSK